MKNESEIAISVIKEAGELVRQAFRHNNGTIKLKEDRSLVSETDLRSNELILKKLKEHFPNDLYLSEEQEDANHTKLTNERTWVIDPLDGTSNFLASLPLFAVVIALVKGGETKLGIIFDPLHGDLFFASAGQGAILNNSPIKVSTKKETAGAMLFAGRGHQNENRERHGQIILKLERQTTYFRRLGSAAIMLSSVAAGRADSAILTGSSPWDTLAGALLVEEAGGKITDYCGNAWNASSLDLVATNSHIHDKIIEITHEFDHSC